MSSRQIRRKQKDDLLQLECEEETNKPLTEPEVQKNLFSLLLVEDDVNSNDHFSEQDDVNISSPVSTSSSKKKKKKKKSSKKLNKNNTVVDDVDAAIREVTEIYGDVNSGTQTVSDTSAAFSNKSVFCIDYRNLNPENELKRKFGANVINRDKRTNQHAHKAHKTTLITPRENWQRFSNVGIKMKLVQQENKNNLVFAFEHLENYQAIQFKFLDAVQSLDHNNIVALLNAYPYHIDSLLQLSEICLINEDYQMASEFIERALFVFENNFHPLFNFAQGNCRMEYRQAENRPFFLALFRHINFLGNKACYRTALEVCRVLLGLDPVDDPLCVLLLIDFYAIKSQQYDFFIKLYDDFECSRNVSSLPNCIFSYALCKYYVADRSEANKHLEKALVAFPSLLVELMNACGVTLDKEIATHSFFDPLSYIQQSPPLNQLISLYVGRSYFIWKDPEIFNWLTETCKNIIDNFSAYRDVISDAEKKRVSLYKKSPLNVVRHIMISGIKDAVRALPVEFRNQSVLAYDPVPPLNSIIGYERPQRHITGDRGGNMFSMFYESLFPSYNLQQNQANNAHQNDNEFQANARALTNGAQRLMDAMRELMATMTFRTDLEERPQAPPPPEEDQEDDW
ncbi:ribosome quality control complex subunit TCF25 [Hydra vulgaris]|uniref:ribosome quality control complex subunit TCF25 n=1 Tax=Hydra vulgaris TaxID=6087 RepID=UPI001F5F6AB9|nr:transcription factor 25 [Hydra vulgaris]